MDKDKKRILFYGDSPVANTGFAQVSKNVLDKLYKTGKYEIDIVGINHMGTYYDQKAYPYRIFSPDHHTDTYGIGALQDILSRFKYDYLFILNDPGFCTDELIAYLDGMRKNQGFKIVYYSPVDTDFFFKKLWDSLSFADRIVLYADFAKELVSKVATAEEMKKVRVINHGCDLDFMPVPVDKKKVIRKGLGLKDKDFFIISVNRNQWRKDIARLMYAFLLFNKQRPDSFLYIHAKNKDYGGNLSAQLGNAALHAGLDPMKVDCIKIASGELEDISRGALSTIFGSADLFVSATKGEGWGLTTTEAFRLKVPVIVPRNTSNTEIVGPDEKRGYLAECGTTPSEWGVDYGFSEGWRPLTNVDSLVEKMIRVYDNREEAKKKAAKAYKWSEKHSWDIVNREWVKLFEELDKECIKQEETRA